jgi:hypothetical protein
LWRRPRPKLGCGAKERRSWNVIRINRKTGELASDFSDRKIDVEVSVRNWASLGVPVLVREEWRNKILSCEWISRRIVKLKIK